MDDLCIIGSDMNVNGVTVDVCHVLFSQKEEREAVTSILIFLKNDSNLMNDIVYRPL